MLYIMEFMVGYNHTVDSSLHSSNGYQKPEAFQKTLYQRNRTSVIGTQHIQRVGLCISMAPYQIPCMLD